MNNLQGGPKRNPWYRINYGLKGSILMGTYKVCKKGSKHFPKILCSREICKESARGINPFLWAVLEAPRPKRSTYGSIGAYL